MKRKFTVVILTLGLLVSSTERINGQEKKPTACDLKSDMRKLWEDHILWTRNVIFNIVDELPGTAQAVNRLLQNQVDIGNAIKPYYGNNAGNQLIALLNDHITIAADLLNALDDGITTVFNNSWVLWVANADAIAAFLSAANPNWPLSEMRAMMHDHLNATAAEAQARKTGNYANDVIAFETVHLQILEMADMLTEGIIKQFPSRFSGCPLKDTKKTTACDLSSGMRKLWEDHIIWTRNVILNIIDELPGTTEAVNRLLQNQVDIGNAIKPYYTPAAGNQLTTLLTEHITIAATLLTALKNDNTTAFNNANAQWVANANAIAAFLSSLNPNWPLAEMQAMMQEHLNATAAEALARKTANYPGDITAYDNVHMQILEMADMLTEGIAKQFPNLFSGCPLKSSHNETSSNNRIVLNQNTPNPFVDKTVISYFIPESITQAQILVYDDMGMLVRKYDIKTKGEGNIIFYPTNSRKGIYLYSIMADGKLIETKKMFN